LKELDMSNYMLVGSQWPLQSKVSVHWLLEWRGKAVDIYPFCTLKTIFRVYISWKNFVLTDFCLIPTMTRPGTGVSAVLALNDWASRVASFVSMVDEQRAKYTKNISFRWFETIRRFVGYAAICRPKMWPCFSTRTSRNFAPLWVNKQCNALAV
jgi:hypothetical protein